MSKLSLLIRRAPKRTSVLLAIIAAVVIVPASLFAWGPSRQTFTTAKPADYVTFNSIIDNPSHGDERNFMQVRDASSSNTKYADQTSLTAGREYVVYVYFHNNAATNLNASGKGVAKNAYVKAQIPAVVPNGSNGTKAVGYVGASNATPAQVWDDISFSNKTGGDIALRYVPGSSTIHNLGKANGKTMADSIVTTGASLGFDTLNGVLPGCNQFAGFVTFRVKADQPNFTVTKQVHKTSTTGWKKSEAVKAGDSVDYLVTYKNTGTTSQKDVVINDILPKGVTYTPGTTMVANTTSPNGTKVGDNITKGGINIGNYAAGAAAYVKFSAKVGANDTLPACGANTLRNTAKAQTNNGTKQDTADVTVSKVCKPVPPPVQVATCDALTAKLVKGNQYAFTGKASVKNGASIVSYSFDFGDGKKQTVTNPIGVMHTYANANATFTARLNVTVKVNNVTKTITSNACTVKITVSKPPVNKECKPGVPVGDDRCVEVQVVTPPVTPVTPAELPTTGAGENIASVLGLGSLIASIGYYISSRRISINQ